MCINLHRSWRPDAVFSGTQNWAMSFLEVQAQDEWALTLPTTRLLASSRGTARYARTARGAPWNPKTFTLQTSGAGRRLRGRVTRLAQKRARAEPTRHLASRSAAPARSFIHTKAPGAGGPLSKAARRDAARRHSAGGRGPRQGYSQGDRAVGQRVRGQDLRELQAAAHHLTLGGARRPAGPSGPPVVLAARGQRRGASQQREQHKRQQRRRRRAAPPARGRLHAAGRGLRAERRHAGLEGRPGGPAGGGAARARRRPKPHGGRGTGPPRRQHAPLSAAAALGLRGAGVTAARVSAPLSGPAGAPPPPPTPPPPLCRRSHLPRPLPAAAPPRRPPPPLPLLLLLPASPPLPSLPVARQPAAPRRRDAPNLRRPARPLGRSWGPPRECSNSRRGWKKVLVQTPATVAALSHASLRHRPADKASPCAPGGRTVLSRSPWPGRGERERGQVNFLGERKEREVPHTSSLERDRLPTSLPRRDFKPSLGTP